VTGGWPASSTQCPTGCGLCCEKIALAPAAVERIFGPTYDQRADDPEWAAPVPVDDNGRDPGGHPNPRGLSWLHDATFMREHFDVIGAEYIGQLGAVHRADDRTVAITFTCDAFDPTERRCTRYEERPLMCENYPFYGRDPLDREPGREPINDLVCAFQNDAGRRVLPLTVIRG
jgi:Fe-S-cluster containining protein